MVSNAVIREDLVLVPNDTRDKFCGALPWLGSQIYFAYPETAKIPNIDLRICIAIDPLLHLL